MAAKAIFIVCAQAVLLQMTLAQVIYPGSTVTGNSVVDNNVFINNGLGYGLGNNAVLGSGYGLANNAVLGSGYGLANNAIIGSGYGNLGAGAISSGVLAGIGGYNVVSSGPLTVTTISPIGPSGLAVASENALEGLLTVNGQLPYLSAVAFEGALPSAGSGIATCGCGSGTVGIVSEGFPGNAGLGYGNGLGLANAGVGLANAGLANTGLGLGLGGRRVLY